VGGCLTLTLIVIIAILLVAILVGTPVSFALGFAAVVATLVFLSPVQLLQFGSIVYTQGSSMNQLVAPLFILMAEALARGNVASDIFLVINKWMRKITGGLALSATLASTVFAALCGSSVATAAAIGRISIDEMVKKGYKDEFAAGVVAAGGTLGIMIPPSITLVVYGIITENSIVKLFMAGVLPGLLISGLLCGFILVRARLDPSLTRGAASSAVQVERPAAPDTTLRQDLKLALPPFLLILLVLGSLYTGMATPTEAAGFGAIGALLIIILLGRFNLRFLNGVLGSSARTSAMILFLIFGGMSLTYIVSYLGLAQEVADAIVGSGQNKWWVLFWIYVLWFVLGCLMDPMSMVVLTIPFIYPTMMGLGFDPIWLGIVSTLTVEIGMITPPVGLNLFVLKSITGISLNRIMWGSLPFVGVLLVALALVTVFPQIALFLPGLE
jgi:C4-dicarboxylate transporter, DctM subunit